VQTRLELQRELLSLWELNHRTVVFVTHDVGEALLLSDRVLVLSGQPSTVAAEFVVPFPRPRAGSIVWDQEFLALSRRIGEELGAEAPLITVTSPVDRGVRRERRIAAAFGSGGLDEV